MREPNRTFFDMQETPEGVRRLRWHEWGRFLAGNFQHHLQRDSGIVAHALHRFLPALQRHANSPWREIDFARDQEVERTPEVRRTVRERHYNTMLFADAGNEVHFTALRAHAEQYHLSAGTTKIKGH